MRWQDVQIGNIYAHTVFQDDSCFLEFIRVVEKSQHFILTKNVNSKIGCLHCDLRSWRELTLKEIMRRVTEDVKQ